MLVYVRHGATAFNGTGDEERLRGWLPLPLAKKGVAQAHKVGKRLAEKGLKPATFTCSDLVRALETAKIIGQYIGQTPTPDIHIRDWNTGSLAGQKVSKVLRTLKGLISHPATPAPKGEAMNTYLERFVPAMKKLILDSKVHLVVGHARGASVLQALASETGGKGGLLDMSFVLDRPDVQPGDAMSIDSDYKTVIGVENMKAPITPSVQTPPGMPAAYAPPSEGPFECDDCMFITGKGKNQCTKAEVIKELGPNATGTADVEPKGCCNFFKKGKGATAVPLTNKAPGSFSNALLGLQRPSGLTPKPPPVV